MTLMSDVSTTVKSIADGFSIATAVGTIAGWVPPIAGIVSIIWLTMQIIINWEKFTAALRSIFKRNK